MLNDTTLFFLIKVLIIIMIIVLILFLINVIFWLIDEIKEHFK